MNTKIQYQKELMEKAIEKLDQIDSMNTWFKEIDPIVCKVIVGELRNEYADIMAVLKIELMSINEAPTLIRNMNFNDN